MNKKFILLDLMNRKRRRQRNAFQIKCSDVCEHAPSAKMKYSTSDGCIIFKIYECKLIIEISFLLEKKYSSLFGKFGPIMQNGLTPNWCYHVCFDFRKSCQYAIYTVILLAYKSLSIFKSAHSK